MLQLLGDYVRSQRSLADLDLDFDLDRRSPDVRVPLWVAPGHLDPPPARTDEHPVGDAFSGNAGRNPEAAGAELDTTDADAIGADALASIETPPGG